MRSFDIPSTLDAATKSRSRSDRTSPRTILAKLAHPVRATARTTERRPGPSHPASMMASSISGNAHVTSTTTPTDIIRSPPEEPADNAQHKSEDDGQRGRDHADAHRDAEAADEPPHEVPAQLVSPERVALRERRLEEVDQVLFVDQPFQRRNDRGDQPDQSDGCIDAERHRQESPGPPLRSVPRLLRRRQHRFAPAVTLHPSRPTGLADRPTGAAGRPPRWTRQRRPPAAASRTAPPGSRG